jgi:hypothetical protein
MDHASLDHFFLYRPQEAGKRCMILRDMRMGIVGMPDKAKTARVGEDAGGFAF